MNARRVRGGAGTILALAGTLSASPAAYGATCLVHRTNLAAGEKIISPYGVDRTGRASAGWHQGLDIINNAGLGDPILSGSAGTVSFTHQRHGHGAGDYAVVTSGDMRYLYLHMRRVMTELADKSVSAGQQIGEMGCSGLANCPVHLHLGAMMRGDALKASGAGGRVWREGSGKSASPLTADQIKGAMPAAWYLVNPEPFLDHQVPFDGSGGQPAVYGPQMGGWRSQTLPRTCSPDQTTFENPRLASTTGTGSSDAAIDSQATNRSGSEGFAAKIAGQERRGVVVEFAKLATAELAQTSQSSALAYQAQMDSALAHLLLLEAEKTGEMDENRND